MSKLRYFFKRNAGQKIITPEIKKKLSKRYKSKFKIKDIEYFINAGVIKGKFDEEDFLILDAFSKVWGKKTFARVLLMRFPYQVRLALSEEAPYNDIELFLFKEIKKMYSERKKIYVPELINKVAFVYNLKLGEATKAYLTDVINKLYLQYKRKLSIAENRSKRKALKQEKEESNE